MGRIAWIALSAAVTLLVVGIAAGALALSGGGTKTATSSGATPTGEFRPFKLPLASDPSVLMLAKHDRDLLVGIAARPGGPVEVVALRGESSAPGQIVLRVNGRAVGSRSCGVACTRADVSVLRGTPARLTIQTASSSLSFELPARLPPTARAAFAGIQRRMDALRSFRYVETLTSGKGGVLTHYDVQAPNRLRLRTSSGYRAVYIGHTQWSYVGGRWEKNSFPGLTVSQVFMWTGASHARKLGPSTIAAYRGGEVPAWFRLVVNRKGYIVRGEMIAPSHFMFHRYGTFNGPVSITPPTRK